MGPERYGCAAVDCNRKVKFAIRRPSDGLTRFGCPNHWQGIRRSMTLTPTVVAIETHAREAK